MPVECMSSKTSRTAYLPIGLTSRMATSFLPATVLRSSGEWPLTSALGLLTRKYSALRSNVSPLSKAMVSALRSLCNRNSVGQGVDAASLISISSLGADRRESRSRRRRAIARAEVEAEMGTAQTAEHLRPQLPQYKVPQSGTSECAAKRLFPHLIFCLHDNKITETSR